MDFFHVLHCYLKKMKTIPDIVNSELPWDRGRPAAIDAIKNLVLKSDLQLPKDYLEFLSLSNGGEGELPIDPLWFQIWSADEVLENNKAYQVRQYLPGFFCFWQQWWR